MAGGGPCGEGRGQEAGLWAGTWAPRRLRRKVRQDGGRGSRRPRSDGEREDPAGGAGGEVAAFSLLTSERHSPYSLTFVRLFTVLYSSCPSSWL